jgi:tetratricopeptide (TPR) repeat protein
MSPEPKRLDLSLYFSREPVILAVLTGLAVVSFLAVTGLSRLFQAQQESLAVEWSTRGGEDLSAGRYERAITEFRTALEYARGDDGYQMSLAQALLGLGRTDEAYAYLINLWDRQPENGMVNLELARIAAAKNQTDGALRFYHNAIYATWPANHETERREARLELIDYLLRINMRTPTQAQTQAQTQARTQARTQAESELIALEANTGDDAAQQRQLGELFLKVQDNSRALEAFRESLKIDKRNPQAQAGAGEAAFNLGLYPTAGRYLATAVSAVPEDAASAALLQTTQNVLRLDPFRPQISVAQRNRIVVDAFNAAGERLQSCGLLGGDQLTTEQKREATLKTPAHGLAEQWIRMKPEITERGLRGDPDLVSAAMNLAFAIENQKTASCGVPTEADRALTLVANLHEEN